MFSDVSLPSKMLCNIVADLCSNHNGRSLQHSLYVCMAGHCQSGLMIIYVPSMMPAPFLARLLLPGSPG